MGIFWARSNPGVLRGFWGWGKCRGRESEPNLGLFWAGSITPCNRGFLWSGIIRNRVGKSGGVPRGFG